MVPVKARKFSLWALASHPVQWQQSEQARMWDETGAWYTSLPPELTAAVMASIYPCCSIVWEGTDLEAHGSCCDSWDGKSLSREAWVIIQSPASSCLLPWLHEIF